MPRRINTLPDNLRFGSFSSSKVFQKEELQQLKKSGYLYSDLTAHGSELALFMKLVIIVSLPALDQSLNAAFRVAPLTASVFIQELEKKYDMELWIKLNVSYKAGRTL